MNKAILIASILGLLTSSALAAESSFYTQLEQGIRAEANHQLQGTIGTKLNGTLPAPATRVLKPAASALAKDTVDAGINKLKTVSAQPEPVPAPQSANTAPLVKVSSKAQSYDLNGDIIVVSKEIENRKDGPEYLPCVIHIQDSSRAQAVTASRNGDKARMQAIIDANSGVGSLTSQQEEKIATAKKERAQLHQDIAAGKVAYPQVAQGLSGSTSATIEPANDLDLYTIPALPKGSTAKPYCGRNYKTDCIQGIEHLTKMYPDVRERRKYRVAYELAATELQMWFQNFYSGETGKVSFPADKKQALANLHEIIQRNNKAVADGLLHPMDLGMRECFKKQILPNNDAPKPDVCKGDAPSAQ